MNFALFFLEIAASECRIVLNVSLKVELAIAKANYNLMTASVNSPIHFSL